MENTSSKSEPAAIPTIGSKLLVLLTSDQIRILLDAVADAGFLHEVEARLRTADPDLAGTVSRIIQEPETQHASVSPSAQKTAEIWNDLWAKWEDCVMEVGNEDGDYVNHEEHWHPPYFDYSVLVRDLETAAEPLAMWIDQAFPLVGDPNLFADSLAMIRDNSQSYPEWYQPIDARIELGPMASTCVLRWTRLGMIGQPESGHKLVNFLIELDGDEENIELDTDACCLFLTSLPEEICREIYSYLNEPQFADRIAHIRSVWHRVYHEFAKRFDPSSHLRACKDHLDQDWHYGEPLVEDALMRANFDEAEEFISRTLSTLLLWGGEEPWLPETHLLPEPSYSWNSNKQQALEKWLDQWENVATQLCKNARIASLRLQRAIMQTPEDWSAVLAAFRTYLKGSGKKPVADRFLADWRQRIEDKCMRGIDDNNKKSDTWVHLLIEAQMNPATGRIAFIEHLEAWLECCLTHSEYFKKTWKSLALLTRNMLRYSEFQSQYPTVHSCVMGHAATISTDMEKSLKSALSALDDAIRHIHVQPVWERQLHVLVPSPDGSGSYRDSALWMKALSEIDPTGYKTLYANWKTKHARRRNLWKEMSAVGCP